MRKVRVAVASSGLGHIRRGVETWAEDLGTALLRRGIDAVTFQGGKVPLLPGHRAVKCIRRFDRRAETIVRSLRPFGGWRYGFGSGYSVEQSTFAFNLWLKIGRTYDLLHVQDPEVALVFERLHRAGVSKPKVILGHGTEETIEFLKRFSVLQHLAPIYGDDWEAHRPPTQLSFVVPNFVDTKRFCPGDKSVAREKMGLPQDALVFLSVGALRKTHKRVDYLLREFSSWRQASATNALLLVAGATELETEEIVRLGNELDPHAIRFIQDAPREKIGLLLQAADVFTLASLHEMMGIAVLEAIASGLPVACNDDPILRWVVGDAGQLTDISERGGLAAQFDSLADEDTRRKMSEAARSRAETLFSEDAVIDQVLKMYQVVLARPTESGPSADSRE